MDLYIKVLAQLNITQIYSLKAVEKHGISHLLIFGDFNFPEIDWMNYLIKGSDISLPAIFLDITQDLFLKQHVDFNTRFREGNESSMLGLIFTNEDYMIENLRSIAPLGKRRSCRSTIYVYNVLRYR